MHLLLIGVDCRRCEDSVNNTVEENSCSFSLIRMQWCSGKYLFGRTHGEREPITGVWGQSPQWGPAAEPLVGCQGGEAPLKLKRFYVLDMQWKQQTCLTTLCILETE